MARITSGRFVKDPETGEWSYHYDKQTLTMEQVAKERESYLPIEPVTAAIQRYWLDKGFSKKELSQESGLEWGMVARIILMRECRRKHGQTFWVPKTRISSRVADKLITAINPFLWHTDPELRKLPLYGWSTNMLDEEYDKGSESVAA